MIPINPIAITAGALSFSTAIAWNKAINDSIQTLSGKSKISPLISAIVITLIVCVVIISINVLIKQYEDKSGNKIKDTTKSWGGNENSKIILLR